MNRDQRIHGLPLLRPYQVQVGRAVLESVLHHRGLVFMVQIARQGGKNELSAQLEVLLLTMHLLKGGAGVKCAPSFVPQTVISMERLKARLNDAGFRRRWKTEHGHVLRLGKASVAFYSAEKSATVVGATADLLLEVDEAQDVDRDKYQKEFRPMGSSANATTVLYGTPWHGGTLLEEQRQINQEMEKKDGVQRNFHFDWKEVARYNPYYRQYVETEAARLGEDHPLFRTQYCLETVQGGRGLFSAQQQEWLQGDHPRRHRPDQSGVYVAGIDLAGEAEGEQEPSGRDAVVRVRESRRDSTVVTIA